LEKAIEDTDAAGKRCDDWVMELWSEYMSVSVEVLLEMWQS